MDKEKSNKKIHWGKPQERRLESLDREAQIQSIQSGIQNVNLQKLIELMENLVHEEDIIYFLTAENKAPLRALFAGLAYKSETLGYYNSQKANFHKLLLLLFKTIGINEIVTAFRAVQNCFIESGDSGFLPDILDDFDRIANEYIIQHDLQQLDIHPTDAPIYSSENNHLELRYVFVDLTPQQQEIIHLAKQSLLNKEIDHSRIKNSFVVKTAISDLEAILKTLAPYPLQNINEINENYNLPQPSIIPEFNFTSANFNNSEQVEKQDLPYTWFSSVFFSYHLIEITQ